jgi:hypothetical protein
MPVNAQAEYTARILHPAAGPLVQPATAGKLTKTEGQALRAALALRNQATQYATDAAFWYGTVVSAHATAWKKDLVRRVFSLLHFGGLCYKPNGGAGWQPWNGTDWPIATALSHSARVTVQIEAGAAGQALWGWLWTGTNAQQSTRAAATHGLVPLAAAETVRGGRSKLFHENKTDNLVQHGVNIGLGGVGNINPHSGNTIAENGEHGHLYIGYKAPTANHAGALLIGCEPSAPADMWVGHHTNAVAVAWNAVVIGVPDQQGEGHGIGSGQAFSGTGGMRWDTNIFANDQNRPAYYNGMLVDLSQAGDCAPFVAGQRLITDDLVGGDGLAPPAPRRPQQPLPQARTGQPPPRPQHPAPLPTSG